MTKTKLVPRNIESKYNSDYSLQLNRWFLMSIGAWPLAESSNVIIRVFVLLQILSCWAAVCIISVPCFLYMSFEAENIQMILHAFGPFVQKIIGSVNYWTLLRFSGEIRECIRDMESDWKMVRKYSDHEVMVQYAKFGRLITGVCGIILQGGTMLFGIAKGIKTTTIVIDNETITTHPMTCPIYSKIMDARLSPANEIMLSVQFFTIFIVGSSTVGVCGLAAVFATHACGQLSILYARLEEMVEDNEDGKQISGEKLMLIVEHHIKILSFISRLENIMNKACLMELSGCTMNMCLLGYYAILTWAAFDAAKMTSYAILYLSMSYNVFIFCYLGEILTEQCKNVGQMAYMTNWYNLHHTTARCLIMIIIRSGIVVKITAGKLIQLSIANFGDVLKTSVVYLNILRTMAM